MQVGHGRGTIERQSRHGHHTMLVLLIDDAAGDKTQDEDE
jgi:hypothetical protein